MRYTDDAALEKERVIDRENERDHKEFKWGHDRYIAFACGLCCFF